MICAREGRRELVGLLVSKGANVNAKSNKGHSAMSFPSPYGHLAVVQYLLAHDADIRSRNTGGLGAVALARRYGHEEVVKYPRGDVKNYK